MTAADEDVIRRTVSVDAPQERPFAAFAEGRPGPHPAARPDEGQRGMVRFVPEGAAGTRVELEHRAFAPRRGGGVYRNAIDSPAGWTLLLERYAAVAAPS